MRYVILLLGIAFSIVNAAAADPPNFDLRWNARQPVSPLGGRWPRQPLGLGDAFHFAITFNQPKSTDITVVPPNPEIGLTGTASFFENTPGSFTATVGDIRLSGAALLLGGVVNDISDDFMSLVIEASDADPNTQGFDYFISGMVSGAARLNGRPT